MTKSIRIDAEADDEIAGPRAGRTFAGVAIAHVGFGARDGAAGVRMLDDASRSAEEGGL